MTHTHTHTHTPHLSLCMQYIDEPTESKNTGAIRAEVEAVYVPGGCRSAPLCSHEIFRTKCICMCVCVCLAQERKSDCVRFLKDRHEKNVMAIAKALGLSCVGWAITTLPRGAKVSQPSL